MFLRDRETRRPLNSEVGIRVSCRTGVYWFPGSPMETARALMSCVVPEAILKEPETTIEFGEKTYQGWLVQKVLKAKVLPVPTLPVSPDPSMRKAVTTTDQFTGPDSPVQMYPEVFGFR